MTVLMVAGGLDVTDAVPLSKAWHGALQVQCLAALRASSVGHILERGGYSSHSALSSQL